MKVMQSAEVAKGAQQALRLPKECSKRRSCRRSAASAEVAEGAQQALRLPKARQSAEAAKRRRAEVD